MNDSKDHKAAAEPPIDCRVGQRFSPCATEACAKRCDNFGVYCEEICIDEIERLQARIDSLMFEYCPAEMTPKQIAEWERHQRAVPNANGEPGPTEPGND